MSTEVNQLSLIHPKIRQMLKMVCKWHIRNEKSCWCFRRELFIGWLFQNFFDFFFLEFTFRITNVLGVLKLK